MPRTGEAAGSEQEGDEEDLACFLVHVECRNLIQQLGLHDNMLIAVGA